MALLTISIPIYNRAKYLEKMLQRFLRDKSLFEDTISLFVSDNCSEEDLGSICRYYQGQGLKLEYNRNTENIGMDGNFEICINKGKESDYLWVLGSDDIPTFEVFNIIIPILKSGVNAIHISSAKGIVEKKEYDDAVEYLKEIGVMITFLSANIISTREIPNIDLRKYNGTFFTQMPVYLTTILTGKDNVYLKFDYLQGDSDYQNNGGYNFFRVFMDNYFSIWEEFVSKGYLSWKDYECIKRDTFVSFHWNYIKRTLLGLPSQALDMSGCTKTVFRHFGTKPYLYSHLTRLFLQIIKAKVKKILFCK